MTVKINADTTDGLKLESDTSGAIDIQSAGVTKVSIDSSGNLDIQGRYSGNGNVPLCRVTLSGDQALTDATITKVAFDTVIDSQGVTFDTTNNRFTVPSGANGYYMINALVTVDGQTNSDLEQSRLYIYKNGSIENNYVNNSFNGNPIRRISMSLSKIVSLSVADYIEVFTFIDDAGISSACKVGLNLTELSIHKLIT